MGQSNNTRIAKNSLALYVRMFLSMCISLYTSRLVLDILGVEDYGIYNIVGGIVALLGFIISSMNGTTSRFFTYEMGRNNEIKETFNASLQIHIVLGLIVVILGETIGLWFVNNYLSIPNERMHAANFVYQCSIFITYISFIQIPFSSLIIAYERMDYYAIIEIIGSLSKLFMVYLLSVISLDKLLLYAFLMLIIQLFLILIYSTVCVIKYNDVKLSRQYNMSIIKPMLSFFSLDLFGNMCVTFGYQGRNILINNFYGVAYNAACGIASQASAAISQFCNNIIMAFRPQIIKNYSSGNIKKMQELIHLASLFTSLMMGVVIIPILVNMDFIMHLWLKKVPLCAVEFCQLLLAYSMLANFNNILVIGIHATGRVKFLTATSGCMFLTSLVTIFIALYLGINVVMVFAIEIAYLFIRFIVDVYILKRQIKEFSVLSYMISFIKPSIIIGVGFILTLICNQYLSTNEWLKLIYAAVINMIVVLLLLPFMYKGFSFKMIAKQLMNK